MFPFPPKNVSYQLLSTLSECTLMPFKKLHVLLQPHHHCISLCSVACILLLLRHHFQFRGTAFVGETTEGGAVVQAIVVDFTVFAAGVGKQRKASELFGKIRRVHLEKEER